MPVIDADGIFNGDRLQELSREARLFYPYFIALANGYGRLEINIPAIVRKFASFPEAPDQNEIKALIKEYKDRHLLFIYRAEDGKFWGQHDIPSRLLRHYKSASDKRSPAPPEPEFTQWVKSYHDQKAAVDFSDFSSSTEISESLQNVVQVCTELSTPEQTTNHRIGIGIGVGVGIGIGGGEGKESLSPKTETEKQPRQEPQNIHEFLDKYPLNTNLDKTGRAYVAIINTAADHAALMAGLDRHLNSVKWRDRDGGLDYRVICSPDKFIEDRRFNDHPPPWVPRTQAKSAIDRQNEIIQRKERERLESSRSN